MLVSSVSPLCDDNLFFSINEKWKWVEIIYARKRNESLPIAKQQQKLPQKRRSTRRAEHLKAWHAATSGIQESRRYLGRRWNVIEKFQLAHFWFTVSHKTRFRANVRFVARLWHHGLCNVRATRYQILCGRVFVNRLLERRRVKTARRR